MNSICPMNFFRTTDTTDTTDTTIWKPGFNNERMYFFLSDTIQTQPRTEFDIKRVDS